MAGVNTRRPPEVISLVRLGLVETLGRPGGNVTGVTSLSTDLIAKRVQLLYEILPKASRVAVLSDETPNSKSRFTESQIVDILKQGEAGLPIAEILRQHNISKATYFQWRAKYAGASVEELKRLKELEAENAKLKRMYAELALENAAIKDVFSRKR